MRKLIDQQVAIDAFEKELSAKYNRRELAIGFVGIKSILENLPSAPPEQQWIPVSERLPNGQTEVIVSCLDDSGDTAFTYTSYGFTTTDGEYWIVDNEVNSFVIAWQPLPEPYREEGGDK